MGAVKSLHAMRHVNTDLGQNHPTSTKKHSHQDDDEAGLTKKARADGLPAGRMCVHDEDST